MPEDYSNIPLSMQNSSDSDQQTYTDAYTPLPYVEVPSLPPNRQPTSLTQATQQAASSTKKAAQPTEETRLDQLGNVLKRYKSDPTTFTIDGLPSSPLAFGARGLLSLRMIAPIIFITLNLCVFLPLMSHIEKDLRARPKKSDDE